jgi:PEP-CTERM motif-containing protein
MNIARPLIAPIAFAIGIQVQSASAQQATAPAVPFFGHVVNSAGMPATDPSTPLFRAGTNPLVPLTRSNGAPITLDDFNNATGQIQLAAKPGGGTDVTVEVQGLFPGELYTVWAATHQAPGFPQGPRVSFGAVSELGDGSDISMVADANGKISLDLVQRQGPMTVQGSASDYAARSPFIDAGGNKVPFANYVVAVAYHFNNPPAAPFLNPGPIGTWAAQSVGVFAAIPEPAAITLGLLGATCFCGFVGLRRR